MTNPAGESGNAPLRLDFDRRLKLEIQGSRIAASECEWLLTSHYPWRVHPSNDVIDDILIGGHQPRDRALPSAVAVAQHHGG